MKKTRKRKIKWKNILILLGMLIVLIVLIFSLYKICNSFIEKNNTKKMINKVNELVTIKENETDKDSIPNLEDNDTEDNINYYYEYLKVPFMSVDLKKLLEINQDTKGWLKVVGVDVNYPFVQGIDNNYYLNHSFDKKKNSSGWVFLDYRNNLEKLNKNTIIYAHGGNSATLFGPLKEIYNKMKWYENKENHYIKLSTEKSDTVWKVFSIYKVPTTNDYLYINFPDSKTFIDFTSLIKDRSIYSFDTKITEDDKILTISTCYNKTEKLVIHAKLFKIEEK